jgi:putative ABC transport system permease protein
MSWWKRIVRRSQCRDEQRLPVVETMWQDIRYAVRALRRAPVFTLAALVTLALGIGATTAIFSVVNAALLKPPPYPKPNRILVLSNPDGGTQDGQIFHYVRDRAHTFDRVAAHTGSGGWNLVVGDRAEYVTGLPVSEGFFEVLGISPLLGRTFSRLEDQPKGPRAVVFGEPLWRRLLGGRPEAIGEVVLLGGEPYTIVGIMPSRFQTVPAADLWTPLRVSPTDNSWNYSVLGRLRQGITLTEATNELGLLKPGIHTDLRDISVSRSQGLHWISYQNWLGLASRELLLLLLGAVVFLLLIACVNVASLQLVRAVTRRREMATRSALGGGSARLIQLVLTESILIAVVGAVLGILVAHWSIQSLLTLVPGGLLDGRIIRLDWRVLAVTLATAVGAGVFFGLAPGLAAARLNIRMALWEGTRSRAGRPTMWVRRVFAVTEVALAVILLVGAGLLIRTFVNLQSVELGFDPSNVVVGKMSLQGSTTQTREQLSAFFERTLARLREIPGVTAAAVGNNVPVERGLNLALEPPDGALVDAMRAVDWRYVTPEYFAVFGIPLRSGRIFDEREQVRSAPVALVNEAFARRYFGSTPAVGKLLQLARSLGDPPREIVGVIADVKGRSGSGWTRGLNALASPVAPTVYVPAAQVPANILATVHHYFPISWSVRTDGAVDAIPAVQEVVRSAEPRLAFIRFETMEQVVAHDLQTQRFLMTLLGVFASLSLILATVGMYGLVAYSATQQTQEVGIRMALGATRLRVLRTFLTEGLWLVVVGVVIGLSAAILASRLLSSMIFGIQPLDPLTFATVAALLMLITGIATLMPALRASRINPMQALRFE